MANARTSHDAGRRDAAVIGKGTRVVGKVSGDGDLSVDGSLEGDVQLRGALVVGDGGRVVSDIDASALSVSGSVEGDVSVTGDVVIHAGGRIVGDVSGASVALEEGGVLDGKIECEVSLPRELEGGGRR